MTVGAAATEYLDTLLLRLSSSCLSWLCQSSKVPPPCAVLNCQQLPRVLLDAVETLGASTGLQRWSGMGYVNNARIGFIVVSGTAYGLSFARGCFVFTEALAKSLLTTKNRHSLGHAGGVVTKTRVACLGSPSLTFPVVRASSLDLMQ